jgi:hypothetical protein
MSVAHTPQDLETYLSKASAISKEHPVVISMFILEAKVSGKKKLSNKFNTYHLLLNRELMWTL